MADLTAAGTQAAGLGTRGARYTLITVWALGIWSTLLQSALDEYLLQLVLASALQLVAVLLLTFPGGRRLRFPLGVGCAATALLAGALVLYTASPEEDSWPFNFAAYLLALLTTRGNIREGIGGGFLLLAAGLVFGIAAGASPAELFAFLILPVIAFTIGIVWRIALSSAVARERAHLTEAELARLAAEAAEAATARDQGLIGGVRAEAGPALEEIWRGQEIGDPEALRFAALAEGIRDQIRSPSLRHPLLDGSIRAARGRGVRVLLLGSESAGDHRLGDALAIAVAETIAPVARGSVTIRAIPQGQRAAISVLVSEAGSARRSSFDHDGALLGQR
ncbi:MAG: hypothetical protein ACK5LO_10225 [Leucobacter sp.]